MSGFLNGLYEPPALSRGRTQYHEPPPADLVQRNLAQARAELERLADALAACQRATRFGRFSDFTLVERFRYEQERVRGLRGGLSGHRVGAA